MTELIEPVFDQGSSVENAARVNLLGLSRAKMEAFFLSIGEKKIPRWAGTKVDSSSPYRRF